MFWPEILRLIQRRQYDNSYWWQLSSRGYCWQRKLCVKIGCFCVVIIRNLKLKHTKHYHSSTLYISNIISCSKWTGRNDYLKLVIYNYYGIIINIPCLQVIYFQNVIICVCKCNYHVCRRQHCTSDWPALVVK